MHFLNGYLVELWWAWNTTLVTTVKFYWYCRLDTLSKREGERERHHLPGAIVWTPLRKRLAHPHLPHLRGTIFWIFCKRVISHDGLAPRPKQRWGLLVDLIVTSKQNGCRRWGPCRNHSQCRLVLICRRHQSVVV